MPGNRQNDPDGLRLPIKIDSTSNGEFKPIPLTRANHEANHRALILASENARKTAQNRRSFLISSCGAATTLLAMNQVNAAAGKTGGYFALPGAAAFEPDLAAAKLDGDEFIFDVQGHYVDPRGAWLKQIPEFAKPYSGMPKADCDLYYEGDPMSYLDCLGPREFIKDIFLDSDTDLMVLSFVPSTADAEPVTIEAAAATRQIIDELEGSKRLLLHGRVNPNQPHDLERMEQLAATWGISAWKTYTQFGPNGQGYYLSDDVGLAFIEKAQQTGVKVICVHKGLPLGRNSYEHSQCKDIGVVARLYPDMAFIVYHSGYVAGKPEVAYDAAASRDGVDTLIKSLLDNDVAPNSNVYAELGSTWRFLMREPDHAAHVLGKLLKYCGEKNVLWGTDSIWYGSPQDQIQAFRAFQIAPELREAHGYPAITPELRANVFGLNATVPYKISAAEVQQHTRADPLHARKENYRNDRNPHFATYGPKTRRQFFDLLRRNRGERT
ncbi:MAG: amidohydrolase family protein [Gammaproteobacteria bacterium]|nr:amidohydrolase family protein [Gammaproteobacteria bacterium]